MAELVIKKADDILAEQKESKIKQVKKKAHEVIEDRFPYYHRENLRNKIKSDIPDPYNGGRVRDISVVDNFIDDIINQSNTMENEVDNLTTIDEVENYNIDYNY